jgi:hypothetical protein
MKVPWRGGRESFLSIIRKVPGRGGREFFIRIITVPKSGGKYLGEGSGSPSSA